MTIDNIVYNHQWEKEFIKRNYGDFFYNFKKNDVDELLKNLDAQSVATVNKIINRLNLLKSAKFSNIDIFDEEEKKQQIELDKNFYSKIRKINDGLSSYQDYYLPKKHFEASVFYNKHCLYHFDKLGKIKNIIDVGAFIGDSILVFQELSPTSIFAFEANPLNFELLKETLKINKISNTKPYCMALTDKKGYIDLSIDGSCSSILLNTSETARVPSDTLDNFVTTNELKVDLIKIDIEGGEPYFLKGAKNTIKTLRPYMLISMYHNWSDFTKIKPMIESWNLRYRFKIVKAVDKSIVLETLLLCEPM